MCLSTDQLKFLDITNYIAPIFDVRKRGDERSFPIQVHGLSGESRRHRSSSERGLLQSSEERGYFLRGLRQLSRGLTRERYDEFVRLSRLVQQ